MASLPATEAFGPRDIYRSFRAERNQALHRVLRRLPHHFLVALIEGLEQADVITPGRLFAGDRGGCAVGVTLRVLHPRYRGRRLLWGKRLRRSIAELRRTRAREISHLYALEQVFDRSVLMLQERFASVAPAEVATATALWIAGEARVELVLRELDGKWIDQALSGARGAAQPAGEREPAATAGCSHAFASAARPALSAACAAP